MELELELNRMRVWKPGNPDGKEDPTNCKGELNGAVILYRVCQPLNINTHIVYPNI